MQPIGYLIHFTSMQITLFVLTGMIVFYWTGHLIIKWKDKNRIKEKGGNLGVVEGALLGLLALILGFTFSISNSRYDKRMSLIVAEANNIGTAILRADLYPDSIRKALRSEFKLYVEARIAFDEAGTDIRKMNIMNDSAVAIQGRIWKIVMKEAQDKENFVRTSNMVSAVNAMIDIVSTRNAALMAKVPDLILYLLFALCFTGAFLLGYSDSRDPEWGIVSCFLIMVGLAIYMIIDLDRPRSGLITMKEMHYFISSLRSMFDNP